VAYSNWRKVAEDAIQLLLCLKLPVEIYFKAVLFCTLYQTFTSIQGTFQADRRDKLRALLPCAPAILVNNVHMDTAGLEVPEIAGLELEVAGLEPEEVRLVIAVDYGTTFTGMRVRRLILSNLTGVAYATPGGSRLPLHEITPVTDWGPQMGNHDKIPSVYSYSPSGDKGEQQWGLSLSENAIAMVNTKLELDLRGVSDELDIILHALEGMNNLDFQSIEDTGGLPDFPWQGPAEIVADYLEKVFEYLLQAVEPFSDAFRAQTQVDIVVTVPPVS
jgi:hypothetical protein